VACDGLPSCLIVGFLGISVLELGRATQQTDRLTDRQRHHISFYNAPTDQSWLAGSVVERRSLIGELSLVCTGHAADG